MKPPRPPSARADLCRRPCGVALVLVLLAASGCRLGVDDEAPAFRPDERVGHSAGSDPTSDGGGPFLSGRVTTEDGTVYEGRLRWGGDEEALWTHQFNAARDVNPWLAYVPEDARPTERLSLEILGRELAGWDRPADVARPFMARFGDIARIDARDRDLRVVLRSGTEFDLDRYGADDLADGLRVWDVRRGAVDIGEWSVRTIEFGSVPGTATDARPLHGTVRTPQGSFTGLLQWGREAGLTSDEVRGRRDGVETAVSFSDIRTIARRSGESALVTLVDGSALVLTSTGAAAGANRGVYVDDARYGRVLVSWDVVEDVTITAAPDAPAYGDFAAGRPLVGSVVTRSGERLDGRLVFDLDESETTETLDAPRQGVDYLIPFERIEAIVPAGPDGPDAQHARVVLRGGQELDLEPAGDLADDNAGLLVFAGDVERPRYVPWRDVARIDLDPG